jgi:hypothetical protein
MQTIEAQLAAMNAASNQAGLYSAGSSHLDNWASVPAPLDYVGYDYTMDIDSSLFPDHNVVYILFYVICT